MKFLKQQVGDGLLLAGLVDGRIVLADMKKGEELKCFKGHQDSVLDFVIDR